MLELNEHEPYRVDREGWTAGPWDNEPDKLNWVDPATDLDCMLVRNHHGAWCGYVGKAGLAAAQGILQGHGLREGAGRITGPSGTGGGKW